ncbi:uncharacterized protein VTP21DRAFT_7720 [Calcarisporiella thermophila]|uniref:uncharacterized protein n=1 Tax=Calcarisporiella thermophila TaxID=911321 RepID=UPI00374211AE
MSDEDPYYCLKFPQEISQSPDTTNVIHYTSTYPFALPTGTEIAIQNGPNLGKYTLRRVAVVDQAQPLSSSTSTTTSSSYDPLVSSPSFRSSSHFFSTHGGSFINPQALKPPSRSPASRYDKPVTIREDPSLISMFDREKRSVF